MKYYIIAGEASGDLHGSNLIKELKLLDIEANIQCWGGDKMEAAGARLVKHYSDLAFMGFAEVIKNLPAILKNIRFCKKDIHYFKPDVLVLVDYPGFNMRIAKWAHLQKIKVVWYISPQLWAWKESRIKAIKRDVDKMLVILPFEKEFYAKHNFNVTYVGHPLAGVIANFKAGHPAIKKEKIIALLPGSRRQEILIKLPIMMQVAAYFPQYKFVTAMAPGLPSSFYNDILKNFVHANTMANNTYSLLMAAEAALVTSGTATLETALFKVPQIICYKGGKISYEIAKRLIKIKFIGLVNLIMGKAVVKELIQDELNVNNLVSELTAILDDTHYQQQIKNDYNTLESLLTTGGNASYNAAIIIYNFVQG